MTATTIKRPLDLYSLDRTDAHKALALFRSQSVQVHSLRLALRSERNRKHDVGPRDEHRERSPLG